MFTHASRRYAKAKKGRCAGGVHKMEEDVKKMWRWWGALAVYLVYCVLALGGFGKNQSDEPPAEPEMQTPIYPVSINGKEILVGKTTVQALLDQGFKVTVSETSGDYEAVEYEIDPEAKLEKGGYYSGGTVWITDSVFANISFVTGMFRSKMGDATIARMDFSLSSGNKAGLGQVLFCGVPVTEISREKAEEMFPDFTGDPYMWFSPASMADYEYFMAFGTEDGMLNRLLIEKRYDVDWGSEGT